MIHDDEAAQADDFSSAATDASLMAPRTVLRVERRLYYFNAAIAMFVATVMHFWWLALADLVIVHVAAMWVTATHPDMIAVYLKYRKQADLYRPWASPGNWKRNRRPEGFGRI